MRQHYPIFHPFFVGATGLFAINLALEKTGIHVPWVHAYLDDLLCMPVVLGLALWCFRRFHPQKTSYRFTWHYGVVAVVYYSILFEAVLPALSATYTRDYWDILCYATGAVAFYTILNR